MKLFKNLWMFLVLCLVLLASVMPAQAGYDHYTIYVYEDVGYSTTAGGHTQLTSGVQYFVLNGGTDTLSTIYSDSGLTAKTNPVTSTTFATDGKIDFYIDDSTTTVDIYVTDTTGGFTLFMDGITTSVHNAIINENPNISHRGVFYYVAASDNTAAAPCDTGITLPVGFKMEDIAVETWVAASGSDINIRVGSGATYDGYLDWTLVDGADLFMQHTDYSATAGSDTLGSLISAQFADGDDYEYISTSDYTLAILKPGYITTAASLNYQIDSADENTTTGTGTGIVHFWFSVLQ